MNVSEIIRKNAAEVLLREAADITAALEELAYGENMEKRRMAEQLLRSHIEGHWHSIKIGNASSLKNLLNPDG